jgi:hypothetical protein
MRSMIGELAQTSCYYNTKSDSRKESDTILGKILDKRSSKKSGKELPDRVKLG